MAQATVFVDDAVLGNLPPVCVKDGVATPDRLTVSSPVGTSAGFGVAWLLLLAGPLGWVGLLLYGAMRRPPEMLTVQLPFSEDAYRRLRRAKHELWPYVITTVALALLALYFLGRGDRVLAGVMALLVVMAAIRWAIVLSHIRTCSVAINLDASRRWVTLDRVHPFFAESCTGGRRDPHARGVTPRERW
jgi:hypothetical protein